MSLSVEDDVDGDDAFADLAAQESTLKEHAAVTSEESVDFSIAYSCLKELENAKTLDLAVSENFRKSYRQMHDTVSEAHRGERNILKKARALRNEALGEAIRLQKSELAHEEVLQDVERLEQEKDTLSTQLVDLEQQDTMLRYEVGELHNTKTDFMDQLEDIKHENEKLVGPELERLRQTLGNLKDEHMKLGEECSKNAERQEQLLKRHQDLKRERAELESVIHHNEVNLHKVKQEPERINKQADSVAKATETIRRKCKRYQSKITELDDEIARMEDKRVEAEGLKVELDQKLKLHRETIDHRQKDVEAVTKNLDLERARHHHLMTEKMEKDLCRRDVDEALRREKDGLALARKDYEVLKRKLRNKHLITNAAAEVIPALEAQLRDKQADLTTMKSKNKELEAAVAIRKEDVDIAIARFLKKEGVENEQRVFLGGLVESVEGLEAEVHQWLAEERKQEKLMNLLSAQREIKANESMRAEQTEKETREQVKIKQLVIVDLMKRYNDVTNRLKEFSALYDVVKNERNKYVNLIQASNQALAEMKEKIKILHNEVDILRNESAAKDKALQKEKAAHTTSQQQRDALRLDTNKAMAQYRERQSVVEQQIMDIQKLNSAINGLERDMLALKAKYEGAVESRNFMGVQLIDRNDELCILYEKANLQEATLTEGAMAIHRKGEDLRMLRIQVKELGRRLEVTHKKMPGVPETVESILTMQQELAEERAKVDQYSAELEDPANGSRWRALEGEDPEPEQLKAKIRVLEERLSEKKEQLLEKELVLEEVTTLTEKLRNEANMGRETTLELAKKVNEFQGKIRDTTRRMMATVSELSMHQATAMKLQQEKISREKEVEEATWRLQNDQVPSEDAEREWVRILRDQANADAARWETGESPAGSGSAWKPPSLVRTTAEPRPNAYIPDELGIPKPYGALAPFKPTEAGSTMRFMRPPNPQEIEI